MKVVNPSAALLIVGNEILTGKVQEANLFELARMLRPVGVRLSRVLIIEDRLDVIAQEVREHARLFDLVVTSGGVGPTHDDVTLEGVAHAFEVPMERNETLKQLLQEFYGSECTEGHLRMADVPKGTELVLDTENSDVVLVGGKHVTWPTMLMRNVFILPGIPQVFRMKLGAIRCWVKAWEATPFTTRFVLTQMDEGHLKPMLDAIVARYADVEIGSYPAWIGASYRTKITFDGRSITRVEEALQALCELLPQGSLVPS